MVDIRLQYRCDNAGPLQNVTNGTAKATYAYLANSPLVSQINFTNSGVQRMVTKKRQGHISTMYMCPGRTFSLARLRSE
jgi:hypothetical protein